MRNAPKFSVMQSIILAVAVVSLAAFNVAVAFADSDQKTKCVPLPDNGFFSELMGITFSPEQAAAYDALEARVSKMAEDRFQDVQSVELQNSPPSVEMKDGAPREISDEILKAQDDLIAKNVSPAEQIRKLTNRFGIYAEFKIPRAVVFNAEQLARKDQLRRETEPLMREILTPEQREVYATNLARRAEIEACEAEQDLLVPMV